MGHHRGSRPHADLLLLRTARKLRPVGYDYAIAVTASKGLFGGTLDYWEIWSGDVTQVFSNILLVGTPLVHAPWSLASAVPFAAAALAVWV